MLIFQRNTAHKPFRNALCAALAITFTCLCLIGLNPNAIAEPAPVSTLSLGYAPVLSRQLLESRSKSIIHYFKQHHQVELRLEHSTDFDDYLNNALHNKFDLTISQINFAEAFNSQLHYQPLLKSSRQFHVLVLKRKDDETINTLEQLRHKSVGVPEGLSFISALFSKTLQAHGIDPSNEVDLIGFNRHDQLFLSLLRSEVDAAITVEITLKMASHIENKLATVHEIPAGPAVFSASPNLSKKQQAWLSKALQGFAATDEGQAYLAALSFDQLSVMTEQELTQYHAFATPLHQKLNHRSSKTQTEQ